MQTIEAKWTGDFVAEGDVTLRGMIAGNVVVRRAATMIVHGMVCGDLQADSGATVVVRGTVNGVVRNLGADVSIEGVVDSIEELGDRPARLSRDAVVRDRQSRR